MSYRALVNTICDSSLRLFFFFLMIRRPPRSTLDRSSAASDVYKRQVVVGRAVDGEHARRFADAQHLFAGQLPVHVAGQRGQVIDLLDVRPVSYTHLRAHETVLDLVCRLLLEKKKQS